MAGEDQREAKEQRATQRDDARSPPIAGRAPAERPKAMTRKLIVIANDIPARDQPVLVDMGARNTASENMAPIATQPMRPPSATITQRYGDSFTPPFRAAP
jgi:hypothetical protein